MDRAHDMTGAKRAGAWALLSAFVAVLLLGAFHPLGLQRHRHAEHECADGLERHIESPDHHDHDADACSFCHLARDLHGDVALATVALVALTPATRAEPAPGAPRPFAPTRLADRSRAPPAA